MVEKLEKIISQSQNIVFFGGAGVSTESGIPDFRSVDGLYHQKYARPAKEHDAAAFGNDLFQCLYHNKKRPFRRMYICVKIALV